MPTIFLIVGLLFRPISWYDIFGRVGIFVERSLVNDIISPLFFQFLINDNIYLPTFYLSLLSPIFFSIPSSFLIHLSLSFPGMLRLLNLSFSQSILFFDTTSLYFSFPSLFLVFLSFSRPPTLYFHSTFFLLICLTSVRSFKSLILLLSHINSFKMPSVVFF